MGFWVWWFKDTKESWAFFLAMIFIFITLALAFLVDPWFILLPVVAVILLIVVLLIDVLFIPFIKSIKPYFKKKREEYKREVKEVN